VARRVERACRIRGDGEAVRDHLVRGVQAGMVRNLRRFREDETGAELVEWAVVAIIALLATIGVVRLITEEGLPYYFDVIMDRLGFSQIGS